MNTSYKRHRQDHLLILLVALFSFFVGLWGGVTITNAKKYDLEIVEVSEKKPEIIIADNVIPEIKEMELIEEPKIEPQAINRDFDIFKPSGYTYKELEAALQGSSYDALRPYINTFLEAEEKYGVNAFYLMCKLGFESGWGRYQCAPNNIAGWTDGKGGFKSFNSIEECILHVAYRLSDYYKNTVGHRLEDVCNMYCPSDEYVPTLLTIMQQRSIKIERFNAL